MPPILVPMQDESTMNASGHCWSSGSYLHIVLSVSIPDLRVSPAQHYACPGIVWPGVCCRIHDTYKSAMRPRVTLPPAVESPPCNKVLVTFTSALIGALAQLMVVMSTYQSSSNDNTTKVRRKGRR